MVIFFLIHIKIGIDLDEIINISVINYVSRDWDKMDNGKWMSVMLYIIIFIIFSCESDHIKYIVHTL